MRRSASFVLALLALVAGCTGPEPSAAPATAARPEVGGEIQFSCGGPAFGAELLSTPGDAENGTDEVAPFLRAATASGALPDGTVVPAAGWHRISRNSWMAGFLNFGVEPPAYVEFLRTAGGGWDLRNWGECAPDVVVPHESLAATWVFDPARSAPGPDSTGLFALVSAEACASGEREDLRLLEPIVQLLDDRVYVLFAVEPLGGEGDCPGNPPLSVTVQLGEPLGDRDLVDPTTLFPKR